MANDDREPGLWPRSRLADLAAMLDCSVDVFTDGAQAPHDVRDVRELLNLWVGLDDEGRAELLQIARGLAKR